MDERSVVTCFLRHGTEILLVRRSDSVGTYAGRWGGVSGYAEGTPDDAARWEIDEETGLLESTTLVRSTDPVAVVDDDHGVRWLVHPYLFDCESTDVTPNEELADYEWVQPPAILDRETVPKLWETYAAVAPTVDSVAADTDHGAAYISVRALEALRDRAAVAAQNGDGYESVADVARRLRDARPSMGVVSNRINRVMATAGPSAAAVRDRAIEGCRSAVDADAGAAVEASDLLGDRVLTLSRSGTVLDTLLTATPEAVFVAESRPTREGVGVAERLADAGIDATLCVDAAIGDVVSRDIDTVLVGADSVLADGTVVNKIGTRLAALAAVDADADCYAVCARDKIVPGTDVDTAVGSSDAVYDGEADVSVYNPTFEATPGGLFTAAVTESGVLETTDIERVAAEHADLAAWDD
ncbi:NUDIX domain-containing protein [Natronomonas gomsonensis]|uniref:NUDIX domain-containing protein n=1 Tax=Natronomonas gomsonensis TaxID=1046043 RepID=UPI0015B893CA|nr:NUDIX domain-containing protein [Natronomonas gomsonensis]